MAPKDESLGIVIQLAELAAKITELQEWVTKMIYYPKVSMSKFYAAQEIRIQLENRIGELHEELRKLNARREIRALRKLNARREIR